MPSVRKTLLVLTMTLLGLSACSRSGTFPEPESPVLDLARAEYLSAFALDCIDREYPNKPGSVLGDDSYLLPPREMHPAFYGCFDWHSAVHGHWTLVTILSRFPGFPRREEIVRKIGANLSPENIEREIIFFEDEHNRDFQRTYGWAWLLKLDEALREWDDPLAREWQRNLQPLSDLIAARFMEFLDKLKYPIRVGEHTNTAFGLSFAYDFARKYNPELAARIGEKAREYYLADRDCPLNWEPGGFDFLSPGLQEAALMMKVLPKREFGKWLSAFLPGFSREPGKFLRPAVVTDASDGKLAHLDGLNFSRAWNLLEIGRALDNRKITALGLEHFNFSFDKIDGGEYAGSHWLASFALYALTSF